jgi:Holliday junction resolvase RusA-like endonuclease
VTTIAVELTIDACGTPIPQGSMIAVRRGRKTVLVPDNASDLKPWREAITTAAGARARLDSWVTLDGPCKVILDFYLDRPAAARRRRWPHVRPDIDKLARACLDALKGTAFIDDARVVELIARKHYAEPGAPCGVRIRVRPMEDVLL